MLSTAGHQCPFAQQMSANQARARCGSALGPELQHTGAENFHAYAPGENENYTDLYSYNTITNTLYYEINRNKMLMYHSHHQYAITRVFVWPNV